MKMIEPFKYKTVELFNTVVEGGYCIGCGVCASLPESPIQMVLNDYGMYMPTLKSDYQDPQEGFDLLKICPFAEGNPDETELAPSFTELEFNEDIGSFLSLYAGSVKTPAFRKQASSGGMTSWILAQLLKRSAIDYVIHVQSGQSEKLFEFAISETLEQLAKGAKSRYYPVEVSEVVNLLRQKPGRYAFVGIPCFVKAMRLLSKHNAEVNDSIKFYIGIFCGHLKSTGFAEFMAWQMGIKPEELTDFDFRLKLKGYPANRYGVKAKGVVDDQLVSRKRAAFDLKGSNWGHCFFKPQACDFCDDITAETADISFGDAWLPKYQGDSWGTNIIVNRNPYLEQIIQEGRDEGELSLDELNAEDVKTSQAANFRHRRDGLRYRIYKKQQDGTWHPPKRLEPDSKHLSPERQHIIDLRTQISEMTHKSFLEAKQKNDLSIFYKKVNPLIGEYERIYSPAWRRLGRDLKGRIRKYFAKPVQVLESEQ